MKRLRERMRTLAAHRFWWVAFVWAAAVFAVLRSTVEMPLFLVAAAPVVIFACVLINDRGNVTRD